MNSCEHLDNKYIHQYIYRHLYETRISTFKQWSLLCKAVS